MPFYEEVAHTPFFVWDPRCGKKGERRQALVQPSIDLGPTLLDFFGLEPTVDMLGKPLGDAVDNDTAVREGRGFWNARASGQCDGWAVCVYAGSGRSGKSAFV